MTIGYSTDERRKKPRTPNSSGSGYPDGTAAPVHLLSYEPLDPAEHHSGQCGGDESAQGSGEEDEPAIVKGSWWPPIKDTMQ